MSIPPSASPRRPIRTRNRPLAHRVAAWIAGLGLTPNGISIIGVLFAAGAGTCLVFLNDANSDVVQILLLLTAAFLIQLRLAANMLDGMVAVEGGKGTKTGPVFNEVPDRIEDLLILVSAGYVVTWTGLGPELGWLAGLMAVMTAYVRLLGGSLGQEQHFSGPMAKPHRMFVMTVVCLGSIVEVLVGGFDGVLLSIGLGVVAFGSAITFILRLRKISSTLADL